MLKKAKIFKNGQSQAIRLPKEFRLPGQEVYVKRMGNVVVLIPVDGFWNALSESIPKFSEDFMSSRAQPDEDQSRNEIFP